jgi:UDP-glucose 6-dehydrogenase
VPVGTADKVRATIAKALAARGADIAFDVVSNPEFLKEGAAVEDCMRPDRIVIGADNPAVIEKLKRLYAPFNRNHDRIVTMDVRAYDPEARKEAERIFGQRDDLVLCDSASDALDGADALVVVTEWKQFRSPDFGRLRGRLRDAVVFDGRNLYAPADVEAADIAYYGIGRGRSIAIGADA